MTVIRLFAGWAESELWYGGPIPYDDLGLDADLVAGLRAWAAECYDHARIELDGGEPQPTDDLRSAAVGLDRRVAIAVGDGFAGEVDDPDDGDEPQRISEELPAHDPAAAAALRRWVAEVDGERRAWDRMIDDGLAAGHRFEWRADRPPSE